MIDTAQDLVAQLTSLAAAVVIAIGMNLVGVGGETDGVGGGRGDHLGGHRPVRRERHRLAAGEGLRRGRRLRPGLVNTAWDGVTVAAVDQEVFLSYTHALRHPVVMGSVAGWRLPWALSVTQLGAAGGTAVGLLAVRGVWRHLGAVDNLVALTVAVVAAANYAKPRAYESLRNLRGGSPSRVTTMSACETIASESDGQLGAWRNL